MPVFTDQAGRNISIPDDPERIISVVPSQTELLFDLGLHDEVIGITKFCVHPKHWFKSKTRVGGTKNLDIEKIKQLRPDLIIANKEENLKEQVEELEKYFPVWVSDVTNLDDACHMIEQLGLIVGKEKQANNLINSIREKFVLHPAPQKPLTACYLIWQKPYMTIGGDTFINFMMEAAGFENIFKSKARYPEIRIEELVAYDPQLLLLSSEPFPFRQKHVKELQSQLPNSKILLVDGEMFSWYGSRLLQAPEYFLSLKDLIPLI
jgi:ABC-type Fe3+-hydroxamate transport system substrate-binding protein